MFGEGDIDVVLVPGFVSHLELSWDYEPARRFLQGLASFARVIHYDRRGTGLSDPVASAPTLEERMDDITAVMDAVGSERAALVGQSEGVPQSIVFAAAHPERVSALVCIGGMAKGTWAEDYPWATTREALIEANRELIAPFWGQGASVEFIAPSAAGNPEARAFMARLERMAASPGMLRSLFEMFMDIDVREVVPTVHVPTLILHRTKDPLVNVRHGRWLAEHMHDARLVELEGTDHNPWHERREETIGAIREFLTGTEYAEEPQRALATLLFTDIVDSTATAARLGDAAWREVLEGHQSLVRGVLERFGGREVNTTGDGFLATFDGPARAIACAREIVSRSAAGDVHVRAGVHTGEVELLGSDVGGIGVHIAARVSALAGPDEVLVSRTVKDLVVGSDIRFEDRGEHELKGVAEGWQLFAVAAA